MLPCDPQQSGNRITLDELHDQQELVFEGYDVQDGDDVGVPDAFDEVRLVNEHCDKLRVRRAMGMHPFDGDGAGEPRFADQPSIVNGRHTPGGDLSIDHVPAHPGQGLIDG